MATLKNFRHEAFAQNLAKATKTGWTNGEAYSRAGYTASGEVAQAAAARLLGDVRHNVAKRLQEIMEAGARRAETSVTSLLNELDDVLAGARDDRQWSAARSAIDTKARLKGLFIDRLEVGAPGDFSGMESADEIAQKLLDDIGLDAALAGFDDMREALILAASNRAQLATPGVTNRGKQPKSLR